MPIRNLFSRRSAQIALPVADDNVSPVESSSSSSSSAVGFEVVDTIGSKASSILNIRSAKSHDTGEYKMSVVNDSGVYLPVSPCPTTPPLLPLDQPIDSPYYEQPSPTEEHGLHRRRHVSSRASTATRSSFGDIEPFSISRESFDSYRRSFDIMARSPINTQDAPVRQSLDSANYRLSSGRSAMDRGVDRELPPPEEAFEDVGLDDNKQVPRKRGFFSKFTDLPEKETKETREFAEPPQANVPRFFMPGRKKTQLGQNSELGRIDQSLRPATLDE